MINPHYAPLISETKFEKGLTKICFQSNITDSFSDKIKKNFQKDIWERRLEYLKYSIKQYFE